MALVSVIIPTYNRPGVLSESVQSVLDQTHNDLEIIVVDDGSSEDIAPVVDTFSDPRIKYVKHEQNRGAAAARNTGIQYSSGDYISFLDDDDLWREEKLKSQLMKFKNSSDNVGLVYTGAYKTDADERVIAVDNPTIGGHVTETLLKSHFVGSFSRVMVKSGVVGNSVILDERFPRWQDWEWYIRLSKQCEFEPISDPLVNQRITDNEQISSDFNKLLAAKEMFEKKYTPLAEDFGHITYRKMKAETNFRAGRAALTQKKYKTGKNYLLTSIKYYPTKKSTSRYVVSLLGERPYELATKIKRKLADES